jgi:hypothetical protein
VPTNWRIVPICSHGSATCRSVSPSDADERERRELLATVYYEAERAGLDPQLLLGVASLESGLRNTRSPPPVRADTCIMPFCPANRTA